MDLIDNLISTAISYGTLILIIFLVFFIILFIRDRIKFRRLKKLYNEKEDKSKQGEELAKVGRGHRRKLIGGGYRRSGEDIIEESRRVSEISEQLSPSGRIGLSDFGEVAGNKQTSSENSRSRRAKKQTRRRRLLR